MIEGLQRFVRIKSLLQDTQRIDSHTISLVVAECDMALTTPATSPVFSEWWETQGQSMQQHASESPGEFSRRLAAHAWTEATRAAQQSTPKPPATRAEAEANDWRDRLTVNLLRQGVGLTKTQIRALIAHAVDGVEPDPALFLATPEPVGEPGRAFYEAHCFAFDVRTGWGSLPTAVQQRYALAAAKLYTRPAAAQTRSPIEALAISQVQQLINKLHEIAVEFHDSSTLRTRITREVTPLTASAPEPAINTIVAHLLYRRVNEACYEATLIGSPMGSVNALRIKLHVLRDELHEAIAKTAKTRTPA